MKSKIILILTLISLRPLEVLAATDCTQVTQIPQIECEALVALYNSTNGPGWKNKAGWNVTNTPCSWYSVSCSGGYVSEIFLNNNQLTGSIPVELGKLSNLQRLSLGENQLTGSIPVELSKLSNLQRLYLDGDQLTGSIPVELGKLNSLQEFYLSNNQLTGSIPVELGNLYSLSLSNNQLIGSIPVELGNLSNLQWLYLGGNQLTGSIPAELGNLSNLQWLDLSDNQLCGDIPLSLINLGKLYYLYLQDNGLNVIDLDPQLEAFLNGLYDAIWEPQNSLICQASLATLAFFKAVPDSKGVLLEWQTLSEHKNAGFYILRGKPISSECTSNQSNYYEVVKVGFKSTESDDFSVAPYSYWDDTVEPRTTYCYLLEDVDFGGVVTSHWDLITSVTTR